MGGFRIATYASPAGPRAALILDDYLFDIEEVSGSAELSSVLAILQNWKTSEPLLRDFANNLDRSSGRRWADVTLLAPILYPPTVYCAGANYSDHVAAVERARGLPPGPDARSDGGVPFHFLKASQCCVGPDASVRAPSPMLDWEGELTAVIGIRARHVSVADALYHVAGYMIGNDLSARDRGRRKQFPPPSVFNHSFIDHKSFEHSAPIGPWIVPAADVPDPSALTIRTEVNGVLKQDGRTADMIFSLPEQISYLSSVTTLLPGDIIMTGTPAGTGIERAEFLATGDSVTITIDGIGSLTTSII